NCKLDATVMEVVETLMRKVPQELWVKTHHTLIFFGRNHCTARNPKCEVCPLLSILQDGKNRMRLNEKTLKKKPRL
ncbi:endonuclease III, partial [Enterococcus faecium]